MIEIDFVDDAPHIETNEGDGFVRIKTCCPVDRDDIVDRERDTGREAIPVAASARTASRTGGKTVEMFIRERDFSEHGHYHVHTWTRRGQERDYYFQLVKVAGDQKRVAIILDPRTTPSSWVTAEDVFQSSRSEKVVVELPLATIESE